MSRKSVGDSDNREFARNLVTLIDEATPYSSGDQTLRDRLQFRRLMPPWLAAFTFLAVLFAAVILAIVMSK